MKGKTSDIVKYLLLFALAAVLVYWAFRGVDWAVFLSDLKCTRWPYVLLFCAASLAALVFRTVRWRMLLRPLDGGVRSRDLWDAVNVGNLVNMVLPGAGEFVRCGYVSSPRAGYEKVFGTMVMERVWDLLAVVLLLAGALVAGWGRFGDFFLENVWGPVSGRFGVWLWLFAGVAVVALVVAVVLVVRRFGVGRRLASLDPTASGPPSYVAEGGTVSQPQSGGQRPAPLDSIEGGAPSYSAEGGTVSQPQSGGQRPAGLVDGLVEGFVSVLGMDRKWLFILYTVLVWTMYVLMCLFGLKAVPALSGLGFGDAVFISAIGNIASVIPVPGGIGAYHYLVALTLSALYAASWETGILYATLCHEVHAVLVILLGAVSYSAFTLRRGKERRR